MSGRTIRGLLVAAIAVALFGLAVTPAAVADHGLGHNGETMELSKSEDIADGEVVTVTLSSFLPGKTATIVTCFTFPAAGPNDCELSNYGMHITKIGDDGTATADYPVAMVPGRCDDTTPCFIVAGDGFGPSANFAGVEITFAAASAPEPEPTPEPTPESTPEPTPESTPESTSEPTPELTPAPTEQMSEPEPESESTEELTAPAGDDDDDGSSVWVWLLPVIIVVVVLAAIALWLIRRRAAT